MKKSDLDVGNKLYEVDVVIKLTLEACSPEEAATIAKHDCRVRVPEGDIFTLKKSELHVKDVRDLSANEKPFS